MCAVCRQMFKKAELIRVINENETLLIDKNQKKMTRGVYLCKNPECIKKIPKRKVFSKIYQNNIPDEFYEEISAYAE